MFKLYLYYWMVDIEEEIRSLQLDSSGTIPGTHFSINSSCGDLRFKAVGLFLYLLFIIYYLLFIFEQKTIMGWLIRKLQSWNRLKNLIRWM